MKKRVFAMAIPVLLILTLTAQAADLRLVRINPELYFDGNTATCSVFCRADKATDKVDVTLTLYQGETYVDSWTNSGTGGVFVSGSCDVKSGKAYKLVVDYSINGTSQQPKTTSGTCP